MTVCLCLQKRPMFDDRDIRIRSPFVSIMYQLCNKCVCWLVHISYCFHYLKWHTKTKNKFYCRPRAFLLKKQKGPTHPNDEQALFHYFNFERKNASINGSISPSITLWTFPISTPVRWSFTREYGWKT
jgi:hypothetical protein